MISTLNNFRYNASEPLYNNENIEKIKDYIRTGKLPDDLTDIQMKRYAKFCATSRQPTPLKMYCGKH